MRVEGWIQTLTPHRTIIQQMSLGTDGTLDNPFGAVEFGIIPRRKYAMYRVHEGDQDGQPYCAACEPCAFAYVCCVLNTKRLLFRPRMLSPMAHGAKVYGTSTGYDIRCHTPSRNYSLFIIICIINKN